MSVASSKERGRVGPEGAAMGDPALAGWIVLGVLPLLLAACTAFTKLSIVLSALRVGLGAEAILPFGIILALALVLTVLVMGPTGTATYAAFVDAGGVSGVAAGGPSAWVEVAQPLLDFMRTHVHQGELEFFAGLSGLSQQDPRVLVCGFFISELAEALVLVVLLLIPFVLVDLIVAQVLGLLDMGNLPPKVVALPAKLLLFIYAGGWDLVIRSVVKGYV